MSKRESISFSQVRAALEEGEIFNMKGSTWNISNFLAEFLTLISYIQDDVESMELDIENVKEIYEESYGDIALSIIPKLKLDLIPFDLFTWLPCESEHEEHNETIAYMRWLMIENCHIEKDGDELLPIVHVDKEAYTESEYHIITNYLEYLGIEIEDLEK
ncbi:hypothetical protein B8A44_07670 [Dolosigranulum pigrum]|uniref:Uncharacterized protein n=1 Tax=Dolosigranulum pigrum TaxID=29394 RepID=A0A328KHQ2_9LACT|nr:hypothetical protein [Dolosigranulum pigrum]RAN62418.1 hypothetical protein B8A44_07670 [Dolosigranulum pigrum]